MTYFITFAFVVASILSTVVSIPVPEVDEVTLIKRGRGTWFNVGLGACGKTNVDTDAIVAIPASVYSDGSHCDKIVSIKNNANGKTTTATVRDKCPSCSAEDLDMSPAVFSDIGDLDSGVTDVSWSFDN
ncbi:RlpA-like domain superfamily protein [Abortiporus biennis]